ncbi:ABC transporter ATP-binding protein [Paragemmobacter straminiformis]|uniref:ABC transporter ATP-binding protein n=1 Tax=Paragemmobacter straminiformis TaxID=2045119 RepID=A0A842IAN5_9RHOB|nr:ABC transporter ATP-binding protein [Gemmobacter straminiformis]MBC2836656.1 ABC transporter ATP-binding protein [Gemmobacter straminiformis]
MAIAFVVMTIEGSTLGLLSYSLKPLFDQVFVSGGTGLLMVVGGGIFGLFLVRALTSICSRLLLTTISLRTASRMQIDLLGHILRQDGAFFQSNPPGALMERVQGDTSAVQSIWMTVIVAAGRDMVALGGLMIVAIGIDLKWTLAALIGAPLLIFPTIILQRYLRRKSRQLRAEAGQRSTRLDEIFHGIQAIKLNRQETYQTGRFGAIIAKLNRAQTKSALAQSTMPAMIDVVTGLGFFAVLLLGGREVAEGGRTVGEFMSFFTAMALTFQPIRRLGELFGSWQVAAASLERIFRMLDTEPQMKRPASSEAPLPQGVPGIAFRDVHFSYPGVPVLDGLSFTAEAGKMTAIVGPSGAGKTTVFHMLTALAEPDRGIVSIGGQDIRAFSLPDQRGLFAAVTQDTALFDETLRENILMGRNDVSDDRLDAILGAAHLADFVSNLPRGLNTPAGPRGSGLSGGQRQRVAIARALVADAPVLLLDEATSALDAQSEAVVAEALGTLAKGRTTLVIAHRLSTVRDADKIVVMNRGKVVEEGRHEDLLAADGLYASLYRLQFKEG